MTRVQSFVATLSPGEEKETEVAEKEVEMKEGEYCPFKALGAKQESAFFRTIEEIEETRVQYAKVGLDIHTFQRFKQLAAALVIEKETAMARSCLLGNEKDIIMEESIECVPKNFLDDIQGGAGAELNTIRVISVGELLSLLEV